MTFCCLTSRSTRTRARAGRLTSSVRPHHMIHHPESIFVSRSIHMTARRLVMTNRKSDLTPDNCDLKDLAKMVFPQIEDRLKG